MGNCVKGRTKKRKQEMSKKSIREQNDKYKRK